MCGLLVFLVYTEAFQSPYSPKEPYTQDFPARVLLCPLFAPNVIHLFIAPDDSGLLFKVLRKDLHIITSPPWESSKLGKTKLSTLCRFFREPPSRSKQTLFCSVETISALLSSEPGAHNRNEEFCLKDHCATEKEWGGTRLKCHKAIMLCFRGLFSWLSIHLVAVNLSLSSRILRSFILIAFFHKYFSGSGDIQAPRFFYFTCMTIRQLRLP